MRVKDPTLLKYNERVLAFEAYCRNKRFTLSHHDKTDRYLCEFFADLLESGATYNEASYTLFGFILLRSDESLPERSLFPRARQALKGWSTRYPQSSRTGADPIIWYLLADKLAETEPPIAAALLLQLDTYARPSEIVNLKHGDVIRPSSKHCKFWGLIFGNSSFGQTTKTGTQDDTVLLNSADRPFVRDVLKWVVNKPSRASHRLFPDLTLKVYEKAMRAAKSQVGLGRFDLTPHTVRHSGPSADFLSRNRDAAEIQARGRWKTAKSIQRYQKPGQMMAKMNKLPVDVWKKGKAALPLVLKKIAKHYGAYAR